MWFGCFSLFLKTIKLFDTSHLNNLNTAKYGMNTKQYPNDVSISFCLSFFFFALATKMSCEYFITGAADRTRYRVKLIRTSLLKMRVCFNHQ